MQGCSLLVISESGCYALALGVSRGTIKQRVINTMGASCSYAKVFMGRDSAVKRGLLLEAISAYFGRLGFCAGAEAEASRSIVVGPPDLWLHLGDSAACVPNADQPAFDALCRELSRLHPVASVQVRDGEIIQIHLWHESETVDQFANGVVPGRLFSSEREADAWKGHPQIWEDVTRLEGIALSLEWVWAHSTECAALLHSTAAAFGWDSRLAEVGYSYDDEGQFCKYSDYLADRIDPSLFAERHYHLKTNL